MSRWMNMSEAERRADEAAWCAAQRGGGAEGDDDWVRENLGEDFFERVAAEVEAQNREAAAEAAKGGCARCRRCRGRLAVLLPLPAGVPELCGDCERFLVSP